VLLCDWQIKALSELIVHKSPRWRGHLHIQLSCRNSSHNVMLKHAKKHSQSSITDVAQREVVPGIIPTNKGVFISPYMSRESLLIQRSATDCVVSLCLFVFPLSLTFFCIYSLNQFKFALCKLVILITS
jgi:hypothetical protein